MDLMPPSRCFVAALSSSLSSMKAPAMCSSHGLKLILTDSVALPARDRNSGSLSLASCAPPNAGNKKQVSAIIIIRIFMDGSPICGRKGLIAPALIGIRTAPPFRVQRPGILVHNSFSRIAEGDGLNAELASLASEWVFSAYHEAPRQEAAQFGALA